MPEETVLSDEKSSRSKTNRLFQDNPVLILDEPDEIGVDLSVGEPPVFQREKSAGTTMKLKGPPPIPSRKKVTPETGVAGRTGQAIEPPVGALREGRKPGSPPPPPQTGQNRNSASNQRSVSAMPSFASDNTGAIPYYGLRVSGGLLGQIMVDNGFITEQQRDYCLQLQSQSGNFFRIGELAVKQQFISEENLALCIRAQQAYVKGVKKEQSRMMRLPEEVAKAQLEAEGAGTATIQKWLGSALKHGASDLHVMAGQPLVLRHLGKLVRSRQAALTAGQASEVLQSVLTEEEKEDFAFSHHVLKCIPLAESGRARASIFRHMAGINGVFRLIPSRPGSLVSLNLPSNLAKFTTYSQGLVLVTGPIGCGKTSTMAALVNIINRERQHHIITVERPVEFLHRNLRSVVTQREVGNHTEDFASALRSALRQDPDVIVIGEMNDVETARLAISAAETGHLVFATLHTDNAVRTVNRVLDIFPPDEQHQIRSMLSESLRGVICQRLVQRKGEPGQLPVMELLFTTPAIRNLIRESKVYQMPNAIRMSMDIGNRTFADYAREMLGRGEISESTYEQFCREET